MFKPSLSSLLLFCLPLASLTEAQWGGGGGGGGWSGSSSTSTNTAPAPTDTSSASSSSSGTTHIVDVGKNGFIYTPDSLTAAPGDTVEFHFFPGNHSVVEAAFNNPCHPLSQTSFFSGFMPTTSTIFTLTINNTSPIWFYCGQIGHCSLGMVGVINPPSSGPDTLAAFKSAAAKANGESVPAQVQGGVLSSAKSGKPTSTSSSSSSSSSTASSTSAPASPTASSTNTAEKLRFSTDLGVMSLLALMGAMFLV